MRRMRRRRAHTPDGSTLRITNTRTQNAFVTMAPLRHGMSPLRRTHNHAQTNAFVAMTPLRHAAHSPDGIRDVSSGAESQPPGLSRRDKSERAHPPGVNTELCKHATRHATAQHFSLQGMPDFEILTT
jgi:hypothetical protein